MLADKGLTSPVRAVIITIIALVRALNGEYGGGSSLSEELLSMSLWLGVDVEEAVVVWGSGVCSSISLQLLFDGIGGATFSINLGFLKRKR